MTEVFLRVLLRIPLLLDGPDLDVSLIPFGFLHGTQLSFDPGKSLLDTHVHQPTDNLQLFGSHFCPIQIQKQPLISLRLALVQNAAIRLFEVFDCHMGSFLEKPLKFVGSNVRQI
jgi:hypothetical protein